MSFELLLAAAICALVDVALRHWTTSREEAIRNAVYLLLAYVPMVVVPFLSDIPFTIVAAVIALGALFNFARMVGLTQFPRFFVPTLLLAGGFFVVARVHWYALFQAMPAFAVFGIVSAAATRRDAEAFLQKMCLAWLCVLVYGYLWAHAALFTVEDLHTPFRGELWVAAIILIAKFADVAWVAAKRLSTPQSSLQLVVAPLGGVLGGYVVGSEMGAFMTLPQFALLGLVVGAGLAFGSRAYDLIVADVLGAEVTTDRPLKGTMLFGFSFALALAYHLVRYVS